MLTVLELARVPSTSYPPTPLAGTVDGSNAAQRRKYNVGKSGYECLIYKTEGHAESNFIIEKTFNNTKHIDLFHERPLAKWNCSSGHS